MNHWRIEQAGTPAKRWLVIRPEAGHGTGSPYTYWLAGEHECRSTWN